MKRILHDDWERLGETDYQLDVAAGTVSVWDEEAKRWKKYRLAYVYRQLLRRAYENGRSDRPAYTGDSL